jgi:sugar phosphate permease
MRIRAFVLTFIAYLFMHALRTGYSYAKPYFKTEYNLSNPFLAVLDASIYLFMGVGFALRYLFIDEKNLTRSYFITGMIFSLAFALFPLGSIIGLFN